MLEAGLDGEIGIGYPLEIQHFQLPGGFLPPTVHFEVAEDEQAHDHQQQENGRAAKVGNRKGEDQGNRESHESREKPAADNRQHAGDPVDGAVQPPGLVGQGGAHGHHEGDIGGGQGQLHAGGPGHQGAGHHQVHAGPQQVELRDGAVVSRRRLVVAGIQAATDGSAAWAGGNRLQRSRIGPSPSAR